MKKKLSAIISITSPLALALLLAPVRPRLLALAGLAGLGLGALLYKFTAGLDRKTEKSAPVILLCCAAAGLICLRAMRSFYAAWRKANAVKAAAAALRLNTSVLAKLLAGAMGLAAFPAAALLLCLAARGIGTSGSRREKALRTLLCLGLAAALVVLQQYMLQFSAVNSIKAVSRVRPQMFAVNALALASFSALLCVLTGSAGTAFVISTVLCLGWSLANYFVTIYHGSPLFFSEFANLKTAANVISGYSFKIDKNVKELLRLFLMQAGLAFLLVRNAARPEEKRTRRWARLAYAAAALAAGAVALYCYNTPSIKPKSTMSWTWAKGVKEYGYVACIYEDVVKRIDPVEKPEGYTVGAVEKIPLNGTGARGEEYPDIILILNESFYDLGDLTELPTDVDYLKAFYSIPGAHYGRAAVPALGGGTNNSETELLTSNSMYLLPISAPFNYLDFTTDKHALGAALQAEGYDTAAMHTSRTNYSRHKVYPLIGFRQVLLGKDCYHHYNEYGNRSWTDAGNYEDLKDTYLSMAEGPRFIYMLTYQNHGEYEQNDASLALVHSLRSFGEQDHQVNEFITSVSMSADAFVALTEYYRTVDRRVILCMVGDHAPTFISRISAREGMTDSEEAIARRAVPYVVWANYDLEWPDNAAQVSLVDFGPLLKQAAGLPLSTYDTLILELHAAAPVRTSTGLYLTADGDYRMYDPQGTDRVNSLFRRYLFMEYNLLKGGSDCRTELFKPGATG